MGLNVRREPQPSSIRILLRCTEQKVRMLMVVQVFTMQRIGKYAEILTMDIVYLVKRSSEAQDLDPDSYRFVK